MMMAINAGLLKDIARLASIEFQRLMCVHGTKNQYALLDELLETTLHNARLRTAHEHLSSSVSLPERTALLALHATVEPLIERIPWNDPDITIEHLVEHDRSMQEVRDAASLCLRTLGVSFDLVELME